MPAPSTDRNLLFGVIALQMDFVTGERLVEAVRDWAREKTRPLGQVFLDRGDLDASTVSLLDALVEKHLTAHGGDPRSSLASLSTVASAGEQLAAVDAEIAASLIDTFTSSAFDGERHPAGRSDRYRVIRPHARGGLGEVFVAEDVELHREVALKEIQTRHAADRGCRDRFVQEAEITGGLEHPGVVPVYGLGAYSDGRPYYAMRLVRGESLQEAIKHFHKKDQLAAHADFESLAFRRLLQRFIAVCQAVAYAHSRGVLHRDLKPGNIMLGKYGETLVVDWGLAKPIGRPSHDANGTHSLGEPTLRPGSGSAVATADGQVLGTPAYMSPEQAAGRVDDLTPASDVYSLGATLYTLLTGRASLKGSVDDVLPKVRAGDYRRPRQINPAVPAALEAVCNKAMSLQGEARYPSAEALAADIEHWLADEPVTAWREPWGARAWRWVRRHRAGVAAGAALLLTAAVSLAVSTAVIWREQQRTELALLETQRQEALVKQQWERAERQRERAEGNLDVARTTIQHLLNVAETRLPADTSTYATRAAIIDAVLSAYRQFLDQRPDEPEVWFLTGKLYRYAGNAHRILNNADTADRSYQEALRLIGTLVADHPRNDRYRDQFAETLRDRSQVLNTLGRVKESLEALEAAAGHASRLRVSDEKSVAFRRTAGTIELDRSGTLHAVGRFDESLKAAETAMDLLEPSADAGSVYRTLWLAARSRQAVALRELGRVDDAVSTQDAVIKDFEAELPKKRGNGIFRHAYARSLFEYGRSLERNAGRRGQAEKAYSDAITTWTELQERTPDKTLELYPPWLAAGLTARGRLRTLTGQLDHADSDLKAAQAIADELVGKYPNLHSCQAAFGDVCSALGGLALARNDGPAAIRWYSQAVTHLDGALRTAANFVQYERLLAEARQQSAKSAGPTH